MIHKLSKLSYHKSPTFISEYYLSKVLPEWFDAVQNSAHLSTGYMQRLAKNGQSRQPSAIRKRTGTREKAGLEAGLAQKIDARAIF